MATASTRGTGAAKSPAQTVALVFGAVYLLVGLAGFLVADSFTGGTAEDKLILFPVNHLHNIVHLAIGAVLLGASRRHDSAKGANAVIGGTYLLVALLGFLGLEFMDELLNIQGSGSADNFLHLVSGAVLLYFGTAGAAQRTSATTTV